MTATQLFFDFTEPQIIPHRITSPRIIQFPATYTALPKHEKQTERIIISDDFTTFEPFGSWINYRKRLFSSERLKINNEAIALLSKPNEQLSPDELSTLRSYSGWGGLAVSDERGVLYDYYTSPPSPLLSGNYSTVFNQFKRTSPFLSLHAVQAYSLPQAVKIYPLQE